ncbi:MAG: hypothetical protein NTV98_05680, partial [Candidatus Roizmanbacteria bacterium]|nr:hypothetical protein [Candidatus Roizmanbacteria bacterium]
MVGKKVVTIGIFLFVFTFLTIYTVHAVTHNICEEAGGQCRDFLDGSYKTPDDQCKDRIGYDYKYDASKPCIYCQTCPKRVCCIYDKSLPSPLPTAIPTPTLPPQLTYYPVIPLPQPKISLPVSEPKDPRCASFGTSYTIACCKFDPEGCVLGENKITWDGCLQLGGKCDSLNTAKGGVYNICPNGVTQQNPTKDCQKESKPQTSDENIITPQNTPIDQSIITECEA